MKYRVEFSEKALKFLKKLDKSISKLIINWIKRNLEGCENPRCCGKGLTANQKGKWRYRIGDYRVLAVIQDDKVVIHVLEIGHRSDIYI